MPTLSNVLRGHLFGSTRPNRRKWCRFGLIKQVEELTEVEIRFTARGNVTVVELEHRGWEARGERAAAVRANYDHGWVKTLELYAGAASA